MAAAEPSSEPSSAATVGTNGFTNTETTTITATTKYSAKPLQNLQSINLSGKQFFFYIFVFYMERGDEAKEWENRINGKTSIFPITCA